MTTIVIQVRPYDYLTCLQHQRGYGTCGAIAPLPLDGGPPARCPFDHPLPWHSTIKPKAD